MARSYGIVQFVALGTGVGKLTRVKQSAKATKIVQSFSETGTYDALKVAGIVKEIEGELEVDGTLPAPNTDVTVDTVDYTYTEVETEETNEAFKKATIKAVQKPA